MPEVSRVAKAVYDKGRAFPQLATAGDCLAMLSAKTATRTSSGYKMLSWATHRLQIRDTDLKLVSLLLYQLLEL